MNALALWMPGTLLFVAGVLLLALGRIEFGAGIALAAIGLVLETAGVLLWVKQRRAAKRR